MKSIITLAVLFFMLSACNRPPKPSIDWTNKIPQLYDHNAKKVNIKEGIAGTLTLRKGDCMPSIGTNSTCTEYPILRKIFIYKATSEKDIKRNNTNHVISMPTDPIATIIPDKEGFYQYSIGPGTYSVLAEDNGALFSNTIDGGTFIISPVKVEAGKVTTANLIIDYAVY